MNLQEVKLLSWANELYRVYELAVGTEAAGGENTLLPVSHSTANAQIEITIDESGEFVTANTVNNDDRITIKPDTGKARTGKYPAPYALNETLRYIAGDFNDYISDNIKRNDRNHAEYMKQLSDWKNSYHCHASVVAVYNYLKHDSVIFDCINSGILEMDKETNKLKDMQFKDSVDKCFIRFLVLYSNGDSEIRTWKDKSLYESFIGYMGEKSSEKQLCYATGEMQKAHYTHPIQIIIGAPRAKLISSNHDDTTDFTYRGRFFDKTQAISVGYEFSQKMHNALKWLIGRQGRYFDTLTLVTWQSSLAKLPDVTRSLFDFDDEDEQPEYDPKRYFAERLTKLMLGYKEGFNDGDKVMILGLDATGRDAARLSIAIYTELEGSVFLENFKKWHEQTAWPRFNTKIKRSETNSFGFYDIANCAFGTEQSKGLECDKKLLRDTVLRLLPCTTEGKRLPADIVNALYNKASQPLAFEQQYNHSKTLETACGMIRKAQLDSGNKLFYKGEITMAFDPNNNDRSYLYGCLLAIADKAESDTYEKDEKRITNARRYWNKFSTRPYQTWQIIEERLEPYLEKNKGVMIRYTKHLNEIMNKMSPEDFADNSKLSPMYLIGFHHYNALLWAGKNNNEDENEEE